MSAELISQITILVIAGFLGFELIAKVPAMLHTPLMSGTNAIHGVVLVGGIIVLGNEHATDDAWVMALGIAAVFLGTLNVVGGFVVTDRMLEMFRTRPERDDEKAES